MRHGADYSAVKVAKATDTGLHKSLCPLLEMTRDGLCIGMRRYLVIADTDLHVGYDVCG